LQSLECDVEWPMCVPGIGVRVLPGQSSDHVICHLQVEWMYAHVSVRLSAYSESSFGVKKQASHCEKLQC